jgi:hypothetical protein
MCGIQTLANGSISWEMTVGPSFVPHYFLPQIVSRGGKTAQWVQIEEKL